MTSNDNSGRSPRFSIDELAGRFPGKAETLRELHARFQQRTFLPERKDVEGFLHRYVANPPKVRTRSSAEKAVFEALAALAANTLAEVCSEARLFGKSQLEIIADAILKRTG